MGRFIFNNNQSQNLPSLDEGRLRRPHADMDLQPIMDEPYKHSRAGFHPGNPMNLVATEPTSEPAGKMQYLKAEIDYMVNGFMRELIDYQAFDNLDPEIQNEIKNRYPQFFQ